MIPIKDIKSGEHYWATPQDGLGFPKGLMMVKAKQTLDGMRLQVFDASCKYPCDYFDMWKHIPLPPHCIGIPQAIDCYWCGKEITITGYQRYCNQKCFDAHLKERSS